MTAWTPKFNKKTQGWEWDEVQLNQATHSHLTVRRETESPSLILRGGSLGWRRWSRSGTDRSDDVYGGVPVLRVISVARQSPVSERKWGVQVEVSLHTHRRLTNTELVDMSTGIFFDGTP